MNYLAHFFLARGDEGLIVGNFLADHVKGNKYKTLPEEIQRGVILHRRIDDYTDSHHEVEKTKIRLRENYGKYAPVISDVFYDYALGNNWENYSNKELKAFSSEIYATLKRSKHSFPEMARITLEYMSANDWLYHYSTYYGIEMALKGLSRRATFETNMHEAIADLKSDEELIEEEFKSFFVDLQEHVHQELKNI